MSSFAGTEDRPLELQMTPMIDCVFLLLIFFMSTAKYDLESELNLNLPPELQADVASLSVPVKIDVDAEGEFYLQGEKTTRDHLMKILYTANKGRKEGDLPVAIYGDPECRHKDVVNVLDACGIAGVWNVSVATFGETSAPGTGG